MLELVFPLATASLCLSFSAATIQKWFGFHRCVHLDAGSPPCARWFLDEEEKEETGLTS
jgi:hypothetical protein